MAVSEGLVKELESTQKFFKTTLSIFESDDAGFAPYPELYTVAGHVAHTADSIDWFIEGGFGGGWDIWVMPLSRGMNALLASWARTTSVVTWLEPTDWWEITSTTP